MKLYFFFCICYPIFLYGILDYMICLINYDSMFTLDGVCIKEI